MAKPIETATPAVPPADPAREAPRARTRIVELSVAVTVRLAARRVRAVVASPSIVAVVLV